MNIALCDDEPEYIKELHTLLTLWGNAHNIELSIHFFENGRELLEAFAYTPFDLVILDVLMPLKNGIETAENLRALPSGDSVPIIFLTSSREFAVDSYDVKAFHYLLKPVAPDKLSQVLSELPAVKKSIRPTFTAQTASGYCRIRMDDVEFLEAQNKQVAVRLKNGTTIEIRERFSHCEEIFSPDPGFFKCHRSYIVNLNCVEEFTKNTITTNNKTVIPISRSSYAAFKEQYFSYMFQ